MADDADIKIGVRAEVDAPSFAAAEERAEQLRDVEQPEGGNKASAEAVSAAAEAQQKLAESTREASAATETAAASQEKLTTAMDESAAASEEAAEAQSKLTTAASAADTANAQQEEPIRKATEAKKEEAEASEKAAEEETKLRRAMELARKSRGELIKELERLAQARRAAAAAGDTKTFEKLTQQSAETREAFEKLNQGLELTNIQFVQQAQMGMMAGQTLASLGQAAEEGSTNVAGMASQMLALGQAIKAGLGPIGWAMMVLQGLQMAFDSYMKKQQRATARTVEEIQESTRRLQEYYALMDKLGREERRTTLEFSAGAVRDAFGEAARRAQEGMAAMQEANQQAEAASGSQAQALTASRDLAIARLEAEVQAGNMSRTQAEESRARIESETAQKLEALEAESRARKVAAVRDAAEWEEQTAHTMRRAMDEHHTKWQPLMAYALPTEAELALIKSRLAELDEDDPEYARYKKMQERNQEMAQQLRSVLESMGVSVEGGADAVLEWVRQLQRQVKEQEAATKEQERKAEAARQSADAAEEVAAQDEENAELARQTREANEALATLARQRNEHQRQWAEVQRGTFAEQSEWLQKTCESYAEGSEEAKKWKAALRDVKMRQVAEELNDLGETFKVTGNYAEKDSRLQADIFRADEAALRERRAALQCLKATPDIDAATLKAINARLKETDKQLRGLRDAMKESAAAAQRAVVALKPLGQKARTSGMQNALKRSEAAFVRMARTAERQASRGDTRALDRTLAAMRRNSLQQEKLAGYTGRAAQRMRETEGHLRNIASGTEEQDRGLTAQQRQQNRVLEALGEERKHKSRQSRAASKAARAQEREAKKLEEAARKAASNTGRDKGREQAGQIRELTNKIDAAYSALNEQKAEIMRLNSSIVQLAAAAANGASAARACADAASSRCSALEKQVSNLWSAVKKLRR